MIQIENREITNIINFNQIMKVYKQLCTNTFEGIDIIETFPENIKCQNVIKENRKLQKTYIK